MPSPYLINAKNLEFTEKRFENDYFEILEGDTDNVCLVCE